MILRAALGLMFCLFLVLPAKADSGGVIAVRGIDVDVTAGNAVDAREQAVLQGQRKGLRQALLMLAAPADVDRLPPLSDSQITAPSANSPCCEPNNAKLRMSTTDEALEFLAHQPSVLLARCDGRPTEA